MSEKKTMNDLNSNRRRRDNGLGPNSDIGNKLRALYSAVHDESLPPRLIDLLEQLDAAELAAAQKKQGSDER